jgi:hypothetical protein
VSPILHIRFLHRERQRAGYCSFDSVEKKSATSRQTAGQPITVPFTVRDHCGPWTTFAGGPGGF